MSNQFSRPSGRAVDQLRDVSIERNYTAHAEGSVLISCGNTKVLCTASVEERVPRFLKGQGKGWITAEYGMLPRSTGSRMAREAARGKQSGRTQEIQRLIGRSLRASVDLNDAINFMLDKGLIKKNPLARQIASVSVGIYQGQAVLDLDYPEDSNAETDMNVIMDDQGHFIEVQGTAEGAPFSADEMNSMLTLASKGISELIQFQQEALAK